jgi:hypothetical protein
VVVSAAAFFAPGARLRVAFAAPSAVFAAFDAFDAFAAGFSATRAGFVRPGMLNPAAFAPRACAGSLLTSTSAMACGSSVQRWATPTVSAGPRRGTCASATGAACDAMCAALGCLVVLRNHDSSRQKSRVVPLFRGCIGKTRATV